MYASRSLSLALNDAARQLDDDDETTQPQVELTPSTFRLAVHNGRVTIENPETGQHRTFRISTETNEASALYGRRFVGLLTGSDNVDDYQHFGFVTPEGGIQVWKRYRGTVMERYAKLLVNPQGYAEKHGLRYVVEGRCRRCNRLLTVVESIETGLGPVCAGRD